MRLGLVSDWRWTTLEYLESGGRRGGRGSRLSGWGRERMEVVLKHFLAHEVDVVVVAGDLADPGGLEALQRTLEACDTADSCPLVVAVDHELAGGETWPLGCVVDRRVSLADTNGVVYAGVRLAGVHRVETGARIVGLVSAFPGLREWGDEPVVVVSSYPALSVEAAAGRVGNTWTRDLLERKRLAALLMARFGPTLVIGGNAPGVGTAARGPVLQLPGAALAEPSCECAVIDIVALAADTVAVCRRRTLLGASPDHDGRALSPEREQWFFDGVCWSLELEG